MGIERDNEGRMIMKHTPGPWQVKDTFGTIWVYASDASECPVARVDRAPGDANARLIAAAPEMYEALIAIRKWLKDSGLDERWPTEEYDKLAAALAKAEGGTMSKHTPRRMTGRCANGFELDGGRLAHAVEAIKGFYGWQKALCGAVPGKQSNGWSACVESAVTCTRCLAKLAKAEGRDNE